MSNTIRAILIFTILMLTFSSYICKADEVSLSVAPSYFNDIVLERGKSQEISFSVKNSSRYSGGQAELKQKNFTIDIELSSSDRLSGQQNFSKLTESEKDLVMPQRWIKFKQPNFSITPGESKTATATISIPDKAELGEYIIIILVSKDQSKVNSSSSKVTASLEVPVFVSVVDPNTKTNNSKYDYKITGFKVADQTEKQDLFNVISKLFIFNKEWNARMEDFLYKPFKFSYSWGGKEYVVYDIPKVKKVPLREVCTNQKDKLDKSKYVLLPNDLADNISIRNIKYEENNIRLITADKQFVIETPNKGVIADINNQILNLTSSVNTEPNWGWILDNIKLNKRSDYSEISLYINYNIKNTGSKVIIPSGTLDVYDQNNQKIDHTNYPSTIILPGLEKDLVSTITYSPTKYNVGDYTVKSIITVYKDSKPETVVNNFTIANIRIYVWIGFSIIFIIILFLMFIVCKFFYKFIKVKIKIAYKRKNGTPNKDAI